MSAQHKREKSSGLLIYLDETFMEGYIVLSIPCLLLLLLLLLLLHEVCG
jgi:hypothetical protein